MPFPFHCIECDKPVPQAFNAVCENCQPIANVNKEEEE
jgi:predicted nucleic acid-binding Zn ribbon protein